MVLSQITMHTTANISYFNAVALN